MKRLTGTLLLVFVGAACAEGVVSEGYESDLQSTSPAGDGGSGQVLPSLRDGAADSASPDATVADGATDASVDAQGMSQCVGFNVDCNKNPADGCEVDITSNLSHCGSCGNSCPAPANATAMCTVGACKFACVGSHADCNNSAADGCEVDVTSDVSHCGACGNACPAPANASVTCNMGTCSFACSGGFSRLGARCASFGGAYAEDCGSCATANPVGEVCGCPAGFALTVAAGLLGGCNGSGQLAFCSAPGISVGGDWAGAYQEDDATFCSQGCRAPNPYTGACSCPAGATIVPLRVIAASSCGGTIGSNVMLCLNQAAPTTTFGGAYQEDDFFGCRVVNPKTGACNCPPGTVPRGYRGVMEGIWEDTVGSTMYICTAP